MKNTLLLFFILIIKTNYLFAQVNISFKPKFGANHLLLNKWYALNTNDSIQIETLKFYVSNIELLNNDQIVFTEKNSFHLIDMADTSSMNLQLAIPKNILFNHIKFSVGIDSTTNYGGAMGGDLDPTNGMYWTWQNGYINFKLEGKSNLCATRNHEFVFHLGGYLYPFSTLQNIKLVAAPLTSFTVTVAIDQWLNEINLTKQNHIMSPSNEAVILSNQLKAIFSIINP